MASEAEILAELKKLNKNAEKSKTGGGIFPDVTMESLVGKTFGLAGDAANKLSGGFDKLKSVIEPNLEAWRELSKTGNNFNNDVVGMAVAVKRTGLDLKDFTEIVAKNGMNMAGLGGSVSAGSQRFVELSEKLRTSDMAEYMRQAGMTNKELNDVMAVQIGFMRTSMRDNKQRDAELVESTGKLAGEMDLMAKLTGKSREEQADAMKKAQADMQVEAKFRLIGAKEGPEAEAKARAAFAEQYNQAQLRGQGQMFKEVFATGTVISQDARMQSALLGKEAMATMDQAKATAKGNVEEAKKFNQIAQEEAIKNNKNVALMTVATFGEAGGQASKTIMDSMKSQQTFRDSVEAIRKEAAFKDKTEKEILAEATRRAKETQAGRDQEGKDVSGATKAIVALGARADDINAALYKGLVTPLNKDVGPQLSTFASRYLLPYTASGKNYQQAIETEIAAGMSDTDPKRGGREGLARRAPQEFVGQDLVRDAAKAVKETGKLIESGVQTINELKEGGGANPNARRGVATQPTTTAPTPNTAPAGETQSPGGGRAGLAGRNRDLGTLGMTGALFEQEDFYGKVAKGETVMTPTQLENLVKGSTASGMLTSIQSMQKSNAHGSAKDISANLMSSIQSMQKPTTQGPSKDTAANLMSSMKSIQNLSLPLGQEKLFDEILQSKTMSRGDTSKLSKEMSESMFSVMDQQRKASDLSRNMDSLSTTKLEDKFKMIGSTEGAQAEAAARSKYMQEMASKSKADETKSKPIETKDASLNDVVSKLDKLNINITKLNENLLDVGSKQIRAVKANSKNLYERA